MPSRNLSKFAFGLGALSLSLGAVGFFAEIPSGYSEDVPLPPVERPKTATIIFGGDVMLDRHVRKHADQYGYDHVFSCLTDIFASADLGVVNLEGPVTSHTSVSLGRKVGAPESFQFTFATSTPAHLYRANIRLVNIGNNHITNFGTEGVEETKRLLIEAGIAYFGDPLSEEAQVAHLTLNGTPISFVSWSDWSGPSKEETLAAIREEREAGRIVFVYTHWGDEYVPPTERVRALAHKFVDAGAEMVVGSHPHIVQESEMYQGKHIYYSLGNLIFDQYWNDAVRTGLLIRVTVGKSGVSGVKELPVWIERDGRTCLKNS